MKAKFIELDTDQSGSLEGSELAPVFMDIVDILGIPPPETSGGAQTLFTRILSEIDTVASPATPIPTLDANP